MIKRNRRKQKEENMLNKLGIRGRSHSNNKGIQMIKSGSVKEEIERIKEKLIKKRREEKYGDRVSL